MNNAHEHLSKNQITEYIDYLLDENVNMTEEEIEKIENHILNCDSCTTMAKRIYRISTNINNWSFSSYKKEQERKKIILALKTAFLMAKDSIIKNRLRLWAQKAAMQYASYVYYDKKIGMGQSNFTLENYDNRGQSARYSSDKIGYSRANTGDSEELEIENSRKVIINDYEKSREISITSEGNEIDVKVEFSNFLNFEETPITMLIPENIPENPIIAIPKFNNFNNKWYSEFKNVKDGKYFLIIEPEKL